ncbi:MAG: alpha/beta hydrolase [Betaproteobacteria bacterium]|nr:alpha/beta hydrolase [Betaproteobacteria bacterium]
MLDPAELDRQYNARAAVPDHPEYLLRWARRSAETRAQMRCDLDFHYGNSPGETLDIFPAAHPNAPLLIFIHGGYWRALDKYDFSFLAPAFVDAGVTLAVVNYGLAPANSIETMVRQMLRACAWLWRNAPGLAVDPQRIHVAGHSAGGHLAAMMLAAQWPIYASDLPDDLLRGGICVSGLYDLTPLARTPFLHDSLKLDEQSARRVSPVNYLPARRVPLVTAAGGLESAEFQRQNRLIASAWPQCPVQDVAMPGYHHFSIAETLGDPHSALFQAALHMVQG